jgi:hypothetical protein
MLQPTSPQSDPFVPSPALGGLLDTNVKNTAPGFWGETPLDYVKWFHHLWNVGDPSGWGPQVFTPTAIMLDPAGTSTGADAAASDFLLLFKYFPNLRGEVVSWARNEREIMINWRFVVTKSRLCPVVDKFSFIDGKVSYRQAYFDTVMLLGYLAENFGSGAVVDYFGDRFMSAEAGSGVLFLPALAWTFVKGLFLWSDIPPLPPRTVKATPRDRAVLVEWSAVADAEWYRVSRAKAPGGPYSWIGQTVGLSYVDYGVEPDTRYFYRVSSQNTVAPIQAPLPPDVPPSRGVVAAAGTATVIPPGPQKLPVVEGEPR